MMPSRFSSAASVIFTAFAERTRNITDILAENIQFHVSEQNFKR